MFNAAEKGCCSCCWKHFDQAGKTRDDIHFDMWIDAKNRTALMVAAWYGHIGCVRILAQKEAGMKDSDGRTALWYTMASLDE